MARLRRHADEVDYLVLAGVEQILDDDPEVLESAKPIPPHGEESLWPAGGRAKGLVRSDHHGLEVGLGPLTEVLDHPLARFRSIGDHATFAEQHGVDRLHRFEIAGQCRPSILPARMAVETAHYSEKTDVQRDITEMVRQFVDGEIIPKAEEYDHEDKFPEPIVEQMKELGLFGVTIPEEYGGMGLDLTTYAMIVRSSPIPP